MYIYHALINALSAHMIHINLNAMFYTHVEHSATKTIYVKYYMETHTHTPPFSQSAYTNSKPKITWNNAFSVKPKCKNS